MVVSYPVGTRVLIERVPNLQPRDLWGYEGVVTGHGEGYYEVRMPWLVKTLHCAPWIVRPVERDCVECGHGAWEGDRCAWHLL